MEKCPRCKSFEIRKDGIVMQKQRFKCKNCNYRFTVLHVGGPPSKKRAAIILYLAGLNYRKIGELINSSHVSVFNWLKDMGSSLKQTRQTKLKPTDFKNMVTYLNQYKISKRNCKGLMLIEFDEDSTKITIAMKDK